MSIQDLCKDCIFQKQRRKRKKEVADKMMGDIIEQAKRNKLSSSSSSGSASATPNDVQPFTSRNESQDEDKDATIEHLRHKVKMLEEELARRAQGPAVIDKLTDMEEKLKDVGSLNDKVTKIEKYLSEYKTHFRYQYVTQWLQSHDDASVDTTSETDC